MKAVRFIALLAIISVTCSASSDGSSDIGINVPPMQKNMSAHLKSVSSELLALSLKTQAHLATLDEIELTATHISALSHATMKQLNKATAEELNAIHKAHFDNYFQDKLENHNPIALVASNIVTIGKTTAEHLATMDKIQRSSIRMASLAHATMKKQVKNTNSFAHFLQSRSQMKTSS